MECLGGSVRCPILGSDLGHDLRVRVWSPYLRALHLAGESLLGILSPFALHPYPSSLSLNKILKRSIHKRRVDLFPR